MRNLSLLLLLLAARPLPAPLRNPGADEALLDQGVRLVEKGTVESGRMALETLLRTYRRSPFSDEGRNTIEGSRLFQEGQARLRSGRYGTARVTLQTLLYVYPESSLAAQARQAVQTAARMEEASEPVVRSI